MSPFTASYEAFSEKLYLRRLLPDYIVRPIVPMVPMPLLWRVATPRRGAPQLLFLDASLSVADVTSDIMSITLYVRTGHIRTACAMIALNLLTIQLQVSRDGLAGGVRRVALRAARIVLAAHGAFRMAVFCPCVACCALRFGASAEYRPSPRGAGGGFAFSIAFVRHGLRCCRLSWSSSAPSTLAGGACCGRCAPCSTQQATCGIQACDVRCAGGVLWTVRLFCASSLSLSGVGGMLHAPCCVAHGACLLWSVVCCRLHGEGLAYVACRMSSAAVESRLLHVAHCTLQPLLQVLIVLSFFKPVVDLTRQLGNVELEGAPFTVQTERGIVKVLPVPVQMWQGWAQSRCDVAGVSPVLVQMWQG